MQSLCFAPLFYSVIFFSFMVRGGHARVQIPSIDSTQLDSITKGRILIEELNCVACHQNSELVSTSKKSPRLATVGSSLSPDYIKKFLIDPKSTKPGTLMPHTLDHLNEKDRIKVAESLTHYLVSLNNKKKFELQVPDSVAAEHGCLLYTSPSPRDATLERKASYG